MSAESARHDPWMALRQPNFRYISAGRLASAMAATLLQGTKVLNDAVGVSYPTFWDDLQRASE